MDNLEEMHKFLEWYNLPRLDQEEEKRWNWLNIFWKSQQTKVQNQMGSQVNSTKHLAKS